jgi:type IV secretion system protein TrbG
MKVLALCLVLALSACVHEDPLPPALPNEKVVFEPPPGPVPEPPSLAETMPVSAAPVVTPTKEELAPPKKALKAERPEKVVAGTTARTLIKPSTEGYRGGATAVQFYPYHPGKIYEVYSSPNHPTSIIFPKGEWLAGPPDIDEHTWSVGKLEMGEGDRRQEIITVRPTVAGLDYTAHFYTQSGLTFFCRLRSFAKTSMTAVSWDVPHRSPVQAPRQVGTGSLFPKRPQQDPPLVDAARLHTGYTISVAHGAPPWVPLSVYDDGTKTVITFKENLSFTSAPAPFGMDQDGNIVLIQFQPYTVSGDADKGTKYIVQGLHPVLELRGDGGAVVRITRQSGQPAPYRPAPVSAPEPAKSGQS